jgi:hypothetical protein
LTLIARHTGFAIALAWPQTFCKQAGAWYDMLMHWLGINKSGYYQVGHAAIVLIDAANGSCHYFDFGRYHAPHGYGRVRNAKTDHDLNLNIKAIVKGEKILNLGAILEELHGNPSTHGTGTIYGTQVPINFKAAFDMATKMQDREFIAYGPFRAGGTNCSRFVNKILRAGRLRVYSKIPLFFPWMLTPTPMWNLVALNQEIESYGNEAGGNQDLIIKPVV